MGRINRAQKQNLDTANCRVPKKMVMAALSSIILLCNGIGAHANCFGTDVTNNGFSVLAENVDSITYTFSGTGPDTVASEILSYMKAAGPAGGVTTTDEKLPSGFSPTPTEVMTYTAGNFNIHEAIQGNVCPPLEVSVTKSTSLWPQWTSNLIKIAGSGFIQVVPSSEDAMTLVKLMIAAKISPAKPHGGMPGDQLYKGKNISCVMSFPPRGQNMAVCFVIVDPNK